MEGLLFGSLEFLLCPFSYPLSIFFLLLFPRKANIASSHTTLGSVTSIVHTQLNFKAVLLQTIQFSISKQFSSSLPIDRTLSDTTTPSHNGPRSDGNEGVLRIPQIPSITGTSPSDCLVSYPGYSLVVVVGVLPICREIFGVSCCPS